MRKRKPDFKGKSNGTSYYDIIGDYELIEASFAEQYGIRLRRENDMSWGEFVNLLAGLNSKTPLGRIVSVRAETDPKIIKSFTADQKRIRAEWAKHKAKQATITKEEYANAMTNFENMFRAMAH